ncbi:hypothetical protein [Actinokineospora inagensis]|uniref:hypothetical protein n=1 Tax=Actinokineospora inagensis TaxID=103730 RepID=UPI000428AB1F|nr:hypothetical protein [Actinokineospora inagensis]
MQEHNDMQGHSEQPQQAPSGSRWEPSTEDTTTTTTGSQPTPNPTPVPPVPPAAVVPPKPRRQVGRTVAAGVAAGLLIVGGAGGFALGRVTSDTPGATSTGGPGFGGRTQSGGDGGFGGQGFPGGGPGQQGGHNDQNSQGGDQQDGGQPDGYTGT